MSEKMTVTGRLANLAMRRAPILGRTATRVQMAVYDRTGGRFGSSLLGSPIFRLNVKGRKTGQLRPVMLMLVRRGDDLLVCGSQGGTPDHPNWWKNLVAAGEAEVQVGTQSWPVDVHVITDPAERADAWDRLVRAYPDFATYAQLTTRALPIAALIRKPA
ncbi:nitroreductase/quinone reductase family protein [Skermania sp. ID1734]|uniref:nitroreductase/quinone reductase family protein n=1 Tax=Skermania sp. ID1734 TaxID=2597516 RepID=UPI00163D8F5C|nr:nitroreductase/quinone reductase family protein [Skermania sp. ID1734]